MNDELLFCPLGGSGEIGMNMNLYAYGKPGSHKWIVVDAGVTFADDTLPGIDLIYPDIGFIEDKKNDLLCINPGAAGRHGFHKKRTIIRFEIIEDNIQKMEIIELGDRSVLSNPVGRANY